MLRGQMDDGPGECDPFLPLAVNLPDLDDSINIANLDDSMSGWLDGLSPNGITTEANEIFSVTELLGLSAAGGLMGTESDIELKSPEKFQNLKFTSTPKSKSTLDSGFCNEEQSNKSIEYKVVLNDITDKLKADFFTSLSDVCEYSPNLKVSTQAPQPSSTLLNRHPSLDDAKNVKPEPEDNGWERNVSIIRRRIRTVPTCRPTQAAVIIAPQTSQLKEPKRSRKKKPIILPTHAVMTCSKCERSNSIAESGETEISEAELLYYTGIKQYKSALGVVKFIRLPEFSKVSAFKRLLVTIMKLRFGFPLEDLGFRLRESADLVKNIIISTSQVLEVAFKDLLPWLKSPTDRRTQKKVYYLHEFADPEMKVVVLLEDKSQLPVCYVSEPFEPSSCGIQILMATCAMHFADSDLICTFEADVPLFYRVVQTGSETSYKLAEGRLNENAVEAFMMRNQTVMSELTSYNVVDINRRSANDVVSYDVAVKICSALVNLNHLSEENLLVYLQQVYARSRQAT